MEHPHFDEPTKVLLNTPFFKVVEGPSLQQAIVLIRNLMQEEFSLAYQANIVLIGGLTIFRKKKIYRIVCKPYAEMSA